MRETKKSTTKNSYKPVQSHTNSKKNHTNSKQTQYNITATKTRGKKNNIPYPPTQTPTQTPTEQPTKTNNYRNRDTYHPRLGHAN